MKPLPTNRQALVDEIAAGRSFAFRLFYGHHLRSDGVLDDAVFSQWFDSPFTVDDIAYATAEHWMMAAKARLFGDDDALRAILASGTPSEAKQLGRTVRNFDEERWSAERLELFTLGNVHKFGSDPARREYLLATGDEILVEAAPRDTVWGIGLGANNPAARDPKRWRGANLLGFALVRARERLRTA